MIFLLWNCQTPDSVNYPMNYAEKSLLFPGFCGKMVKVNG